MDSGSGLKNKPVQKYPATKIWLVIAFVTTIAVLLMWTGNIQEIQGKQNSTETVMTDSRKPIKNTKENTGDAEKLWFCILVPTVWVLAGVSFLADKEEYKNELRKWEEEKEKRNR